MAISISAMKYLYIETTLLQRNRVCLSDAIFNAGFHEMFAYKAIKMVYKWHLGVFYPWPANIWWYCRNWKTQEFLHIALWWKSAIENNTKKLIMLGRFLIVTHTGETLYNTVNFCWSTHKRHSIARPKGRGMRCLLWVQRATYCVDLSKLSFIKYLL